MLSPSDSLGPAPERAGLHPEAPLIGGWSVVYLLLSVHVVSGLWLWLSETDDWLGAFFVGRVAESRLAVGGQEFDAVAGGEIWRLATSTLLHVDPAHLIFNSVGVLVLARLLEPWIGTTRWLCWLAIGGLAGSVGSQLAGLELSDGASGGAYALLGATVVLAVKHRDDLPADDRKLYGPYLLGLLVFNLLLSLVLPFIDGVAHVVGLVTGGGLAALPVTRWTLRMEAVGFGLWLGAVLFGWGFG